MLPLPHSFFIFTMFVARGSKTQCPDISRAGALVSQMADEHLLDALHISLEPDITDTCKGLPQIPPHHHQGMSSCYILTTSFDELVS